MIEYGQQKRVLQFSYKFYYSRLSQLFFSFGAFSHMTRLLAKLYLFVFFRFKGHTCSTMLSRRHINLSIPSTIPSKKRLRLKRTGQIVKVLTVSRYCFYSIQCSETACKPLQTITVLIWSQKFWAQLATYTMFVCAGPVELNGRTYLITSPTQPISHKLEQTSSYDAIGFSFKQDRNELFVLYIGRLHIKVGTFLVKFVAR